ncbi:MAG: phosphatase PAP2 family protein [Holophaga sp.]|jgi:membrane-associated phospholipid phosphatase
MRLLRFSCVLALGLSAVAVVPAAGRQLPPATVQAPAYAALIGDYPGPGSEGAKADQAILLWLQTTRTQDAVARARSEADLALGVFSPVTGKDLESPGFPLTRALAEDLRLDLRRTTGSLKDWFARPRPYQAMAQIKPAVRLETNSSYPSGHSAWGVAEATLLAALEPGRREAILDRGRLVGYDRALAGVHYPSDVEAGQRVGEAFAQTWLAAHQARVDQARAAEWGQ